MFHNKKGFTLVELLVVIAVIALLVSIVIPNVMGAKRKADGATDAANLRTVLGEVNTELTAEKPIEDIVKELQPVESKVVPGAKLWVVYVKPVSLYTYFVKDGAFYSMDYMVDVARSGKSEESTEFPKLIISNHWYELGIGRIDPKTGNLYETK